jgi:hypothetical protein
MPTRTASGECKGQTLDPVRLICESQVLCLLVVY